MTVLSPRMSCTASQSYYTCSASGFTGCCSVNACDFPQGCPDSGSSGQSSGVPTTSKIITVHSGTLTSTETLRSMTSSIPVKISTTSHGVVTLSFPHESSISSTTTKVTKTSPPSKSMPSTTAVSTTHISSTFITVTHSTTTTRTMIASKTLGSTSSASSHTPPATPSATPQSSSHHTGVVVGSAFAGIFALLAIIMLVRFCLRIKQGRKTVIERRIEEERIAREIAVERGGYDPRNLF
ncbi:Glycoside hydrolase 18 protein [Varicellaria rhodocarpa]|nr:Glycoside hydrolase 18 protein [Varicellaria rhodocarpa]